jgi:hypothetical protein
MIILTQKNKITRQNKENWSFPCLNVKDLMTILTYIKSKTKVVRFHIDQHLKQVANQAVYYYCTNH